MLIALAKSLCSMASATALVLMSARHHPERRSKQLVLTYLSDSLKQGHLDNLVLLDANHVRGRFGCGFEQGLSRLDTLEGRLRRQLSCFERTSDPYG